MSAIFRNAKWWERAIMFAVWPFIAAVILFAVFLFLLIVWLYPLFGDVEMEA